MNFRGTNYSQTKWNDLQKLEYDLKLHDELHSLYKYVTKLAIVCIKRGIPLIIENPYSSTHYLVKYWAIKSKIIDEDRTERGDYFKKPTQYWFINRKPSNNLIFDQVAIHPKRIITKTKNGENGINATKQRSMISPDYANRFIREFII